MRINNLKAVLVLAASLFSLSFANSVAQGTYAISAGDEFKAGQEITSVPGVTLVMPALAQNDDTETPTGAAQSSANWADIDFVAFTPGNGGNPKLTSGVWHGTTYTFKVAESGTITAGVVLNANKTLVLVKNDTEDVLATATYFLPDALGNASQTLDDNKRVAVKSQGTVTFPVEAGNTYNIHCAGSKMGFYGFKFTTGAAPKEISYENAGVLSFNTMGLYGGAGTKANEITGVKGTTAKGFKMALVNKSIELEAAPNLILNGESHKTINLPAGEQVKITMPKGYLATNLAIVAFVNKYDSTATVRPTYFSEVNGVAYTVENTDTLTSYRNFEKPDTLIFACEELTELSLTGAGEDIAFVAVVTMEKDPYYIAPISGTELLRNGDFAAWTEGQPTWWDGKAGNATIACDTLEEGNYAVQIVNESGNKRIAYHNVPLKKGTYIFSFMAKGAAAGAQFQYGYAVVKDGAIASDGYNYKKDAEGKDFVAAANATRWLQYIDTITIAEDATIIDLVIMSKKNTADLLVDDASLKTSDGGIMTTLAVAEDYVTLFEGETYTIKPEVGPFGDEGTPTFTPSSVALTVTTAGVVTAVSAGKAAIDVTLAGISKTINFTVFVPGTGMETEQNVTGVAGTQLEGQSYIVAGDIVSGELADNSGFETFKSDNTTLNVLTFNVKKGAFIKSIKIWGASNGKGRASNSDPIYVTGIMIDGGENILEPAEAAAKGTNSVTNVMGLPEYKDAASMALVLDTTNVGESIVFTFDNTNAMNKQVVFKYTIEYELPSIEITSPAVADTTIAKFKSFDLAAKVLPKYYIREGGDTIVSYQYAAEETQFATTLVGNKVTSTGDGSDTIVAYVIDVNRPGKPLATDTLIVNVEEIFWNTVVNFDFEDQEDADAWKLQNTQLSVTRQTSTTCAVHGSAVDNFNCYVRVTGGSGNRWSYLDFSSSLFLNAENWTLDFDNAICSQNHKGGTTSFAIVGSLYDNKNAYAATDTIMAVSVAGTGTTANVLAGDKSVIGTLEVAVNNATNRNNGSQLWNHFSLEGVKADNAVYLTIKALDGTEKLARIKVCDFKNVMGIAGQGGRGYGHFAFNDIIGRIGTKDEIVLQPEISAAGSESKSQTITITSPAPVDSILYSINGKDTTKYVAPFVIKETSKITAWAIGTSSKTGAVMESDDAVKEIKAGEVEKPIFTWEETDGNYRCYSVADSTKDAMIWYTWDYTNKSDVPSSWRLTSSKQYMNFGSDVTLYAFARTTDKNGEYFSDTVKCFVDAGSLVKLADVVFTRIDKNGDARYAEYGDTLSAWTVSYKHGELPVASADTPTVNLSVQYITVDYKDTTLLGSFASGDTIEHIPFGCLYGWATPDNTADFLPGEGHAFFRPLAEIDTVFYIEFDSLAYRDGYTDAPVLQSKDNFTANGVTMAPINISKTVDGIVVADSAINRIFGVQAGTKWLNRNVEVGGLYSYNGGWRSIGFKEAKKGQQIVITIKGKDGSEFEGIGAFDLNGSSSNVTYNETLSNGKDALFIVNADGPVQFSIHRYSYIQKISFYTTSDIISAPSVWVDSVSNTNQYLAMKPYETNQYASVYYSFLTSDSIQGSVFAGYDSTQVDRKWQTSFYNNYETGEVQLTYKDTTLYQNRTRLFWTPFQQYEELTLVPYYFNNYQKYDENWNQLDYQARAVVRTYAEYMGLQSDVKYDTIMALNDLVRLNRPVITYVGTKEDTLKMFVITIDNSDLVSAPENTTISYYNLDSAKYLNYKLGDTITVDSESYGWMTAYQYKYGYRYSADAYRYVDSRESYNETYTAMYGTIDTIMPAATADFEIAQNARFTSTTLKPTGRVYYHRGSMSYRRFYSLVLPFAFNDDCYVMTHDGKVLQRNVDYHIYNWTSLGNGNRAMDADTGTLLAEDMDMLVRAGSTVGYTGAYLFRPEVYDQDFIFVSGKGATQFRVTEPTFTMPEAGWRIVSNTTFKNQQVPVKAYRLEPSIYTYDAENGYWIPRGSGLVPVEPNTYNMAPFTSVVLYADTAAVKDTIYLNCDYEKFAVIKVNGVELTGSDVTVSFNALPATWDSELGEYKYLPFDEFITYSVTMTDEKGNELGKATAKNVESADYTATIKGAGEAGKQVTITITATIPGLGEWTGILNAAATGIEAIESDDAFANDGAIYNLNGIRVDKQNVKGGIYIQSGKKLQLK